VSVTESKTQIFGPLAQIRLPYGASDDLRKMIREFIENPEACDLA